MTLLLTWCCSIRSLLSHPSPCHALRWRGFGSYRDIFKRVAAERTRASCVSNVTFSRRSSQRRRGVQLKSCIWSSGWWATKQRSSRIVSLSLYNFPLYNFPLHNSERGLASSPAAVSSEPSAAGLHAVPLHSPRGGEKKSAMDTEMVAVKAGRRALCRPPRAPHAYSPRQSGAARPCSTPPGGARQGPIVGYVLQSAAPTGPSP